jgi:hypothetical protein
MLKNEMESYLRIGGRVEKSYVPLHGDRGGTNTFLHNIFIVDILY